MRYFKLFFHSGGIDAFTTKVLVGSEAEAIILASEVYPDFKLKFVVEIE